MTVEAKDALLAELAELRTENDELRELLSAYKTACQQLVIGTGIPRHDLSSVIETR